MLKTTNNSIAACHFPFRTIIHLLLQVEELILSRNRLSGVNVSLLAAALVRRPQLTVLDLSRNELDSEATSALCSALAEAKALSVLRLRDNNIGADGAMAVAKMLMVGSLPLKELDLGHNLVQDAGAVAIAGAIGSDMSQLERLNLDFNNISATGAEALAKAMTQSPALRHLSVVDNQLGDEGTSLLETALENSKVEELYLRGNSSASAGTSI